MARKVYTTGTMYEKETGRYQSEPWADRPVSRSKKKVGTGTAKAVKGERDRLASKRGVGQASIDGFVNNSGRAIAKKALAEQKKPKTVTDLHNARNRKLVAEYVLANKNANKKKPPRSK